MNYPLVQEEIAIYVSNLFNLQGQVHYPYHNLEHTKAVVAHAMGIAAFYSLAEKDSFVIYAAAWFHDTGQLSGDMQGHEERGVSIMKGYFHQADIFPGFMAASAACIMATGATARPQTLPEEIICDADTWHFGTPFFRETEFLVKKEMETRTGRIITDWHRRSLQLLKNHVFYTGYCRQLLEKGKEQNIAWLQSLID